MEKEKDTLLQNKGKLKPGGASQLNVSWSKYDKREDEKKLKHSMWNTPWVPQVFLSIFFNSRKRGASEICTSWGPVSGFGVQCYVLRSSISYLDLATRELL